MISFLLWFLFGKAIITSVFVFVFVFLCILNSWLVQRLKWSNSCCRIWVLHVASSQATKYCFQALLLQYFGIIATSLAARQNISIFINIYLLPGHNEGILQANNNCFQVVLFAIVLPLTHHHWHWSCYMQNINTSGTRVQSHPAALAMILLFTKHWYFGNASQQKGSGQHHHLICFFLYFG